MSTRRSLRLGDAALWDSPLECGDISMDCLSQKMHFPTPGKKHTKKTKIGQQNLAGGRSDEARFSRWLRLLSKGEEKSGALSAIHGGSSQEHIYIWIRAIWLSHPRTEKMWWTIRGLLTRQKDRREMKNKKIQFGKKETSPSIVEELKNIYIYRERSFLGSLQCHFWM